MPQKGEQRTLSQEYVNMRPRCRDIKKEQERHGHNLPHHALYKEDSSTTPIHIYSV